MSVFVKNFVAGCAVCQQMKTNTHPSSPGLIPTHTDPGALPFSQVTCDFITDLPLSASFDSLMVVVDHLSTKGVICIPCHKTIDAQTTAQNFINHVFRHFSLPNSFLSDRGPQFSSQVFKEIAQILGFKTLRSTAYHPQTVGETERVNQKRFGPFKITEVLGPVSYQLQLPGTWRIHPVFHAILLSPYLETAVHGLNYMRPPPDLIEGEEQYEVEAIQGHKRWGRGYWYLVKWANYPISDNTWQSAEDLKDAPGILSEYQRLHNL